MLEYGKKTTPLHSQFQHFTLPIFQHSSEATGLPAVVPASSASSAATVATMTMPTPGHTQRRQHGDNTCQNDTFHTMTPLRPFPAHLPFRNP
jgi:hypothetical protein